MTDTTIKVSIAKLGTSIQEVEIPTGGNVMDALRKAGFNLDGVVSVKRNGAVATLDTSLELNDVLLVSMEKIKGGADEEANLLRLAFTIEKENQPEPNDSMMFTDDMTTFEIVKQVMRNYGVSLNDFKEIRNEDDTVVSLADKLENNKSYKIITCAQPGCGEGDEEENYDD